jgi:hypothetical protein
MGQQCSSLFFSHPLNLRPAGKGYKIITQSKRAKTGVTCGFYVIDLRVFAAV